VIGYPSFGHIPAAVAATPDWVVVCAREGETLIDRRRMLSLALAAVLLAALVTISGCAARPAGGLASSPVATAVSSATSTIPSAAATASPMASAPVTFAVIGDYGTGDAHEAAVAKLVASWNPAFVIAAGDDYYAQAGGTGTAKYDQSTGAYYGAWLKDIRTTGHVLPVGKAAVNAFFPALGNHDYSDATPSPDTYLTYFTLPGAGFPNTSGNERYYDYVEGPIHFFVLNSNPQEPDGTSATSAQARWLKAQLTASTSPWNIVCDHHPPYSSDTSHGSTLSMRWPFAAWGADVVISGHAHVYERVVRGGVVYFVNGLGGAKRYLFGKPVSGSKLRYRADWGAQKVTATDTTLDFRFLNVRGTVIDHYRLSTP
jgi:hypothetical protein